MGIYLNPNFENFRRTLAAEIYVEKTMMIAEINKFIDHGNNYICVSRPRRFGKTIAGNMLSAYYSKGCDSRELFAGCKIANVSGYEEKMNQYNVIKLDINGAYQNIREKERMIDILTEKIKTEMRKEFPSVSLPKEYSLAESILERMKLTYESVKPVSKYMLIISAFYQLSDYASGNKADRS